jgi:lysophospholipase L1-like esterase
MRATMNDWIHNGGAFDQVADYDAVLRDPATPDRILPSYDSGDALHPNDDGHRALAEAFDLSRFHPRD